MALWIWNSPDWPELRFDERRLLGPLAAARAELGRLLGKADAIGALEFASVERDLWCGEALATAAIEGEQLNLAGVRSSVARRLGLPVESVVGTPRELEGLLDVMQDATLAWNADLTTDRLCRWQSALFPAGGGALRSVVIGRWRPGPDPMQIVSGPVGREAVHYEAPPADRLDAEMRRFAEWFNHSQDEPIDGLLRAGLAHVWFESIHPFEDGNGRVGRALIDLALAQDVRRPTRLHGVAAELERRRDAYYDALNAAQRGDGDVTEWLAWFLEVVAAAAARSGLVIDVALTRAQFWAEPRTAGVTARQRKVLNRMLDAGPGGFTGGLTARKYAGMTGVSTVTAWRDIEALVQRGLLVSGTAGGRSTYYDLALPGWEWRSLAAR
jgi:Fic family protein